MAPKNKIDEKKTIINSRLETISTKIIFKDSFLKRKCIIPTNGYFEWKIINNEKHPFFINLPDKEIIYFAAIWRIEKTNNNTLSVCCIITKEANSKMSKRNMKYAQKDSEEAEDILGKFGIKDDELENIFDIIAKSNPEL